LDYRMHHGTLPFGGAAVVLGEAWPMFLVLIVILLWLFPDGRLPPGRITARTGITSARPLTGRPPLLVFARYATA